MERTFQTAVVACPSSSPLGGPALQSSSRCTLSAADCLPLPSSFHASLHKGRIRLYGGFHWSSKRYHSPQLRHARKGQSSSQQPSSAAIEVRSQMVGFAARREVHIPYKERARPAEDYVKEVERVVKIIFPDSARIRYLGGSVWRAHLRPVTFFTLSARPACDIKVFYEDRALQISSNKLMLEFMGFPGEFKDLHFQFSLQGELTVGKGSPRTAIKAGGNTFQGWVALGLKVDLPLPFSVMPEAIVISVGNGILEQIIGAMENALVAGIIRDYNLWCQNQIGDSINSKAWRMHW